MVQWCTKFRDISFPEPVFHSNPQIFHDLIFTGKKLAFCTKIGSQSLLCHHLRWIFGLKAKASACVGLMFSILSMHKSEAAMPA